MTDLPSSLRLAPCSSRHGQRGIVVLQQMLHGFQIPRRSLESLDLFTQLGLLSLFGAYHFVDILQEKPPLLTLTVLSAGSNARCTSGDYLSK